MDDSSTNTFVWTPDLISKLIQLRYDKRDEFKVPTKHGNPEAWMVILREMHLENQISPLTIRKKWHSLLHKFKEIENKIFIGSCGEDIAWPHYNHMQIVMNELSTQINPSIMATSNSNEPVKIQFSDMPADGAENEGEILGHRPSKRNKRDITDAKFIAVVEEGNEQLKAMHATIEKQGETFLQLMSRIVHVLERQVSDDVPM